MHTKGNNHITQKDPKIMEVILIQQNLTSWLSDVPDKHYITNLEQKDGTNKRKHEESFKCLLIGAGRRAARYLLQMSKEYC